MSARPMRLFHFSDDPAIARFDPRPVRVPSRRPPGREWLNGPLVWAIDEDHAPLYLFPRDCPRILLWPTEATTAEDRERWWGGRTARMRAFVEEGWLEALASAVLYRYLMPRESFRSLEDAGMWVSRRPVTPEAMEPIDDLPGALARSGVELEALPSLAPLSNLWSTTLHASGIRLRHARDWPA